MFFWSKYPFVRLTIFFISGILAGLYLPANPFLATILLLVSAIVYVSLYYFKRKLLLSQNYLFGITIGLIFALLGYMSIGGKVAKNDTKNIINQPLTAYQAIVISEPEQRGDFVRVKLNVTMVNDSLWRSGTGKILAYLRDDSATSLKYGDLILVNNAPARVKPPLNPGEFNYKQYLQTLGVTHQHFINAEDWLLTRSPQSFSFRGYSILIRNKLEEILDRYISNPEARAIAKALILGNKEELSEETRSEFSKAGAMHVLAVSGLHVGIIYLILLMLLNQRRGGLRKPILVALIIIPVLWVYAFITGLSPSVLRAVTMFSLLAVGQSLNKKPSSINLLALSAFILLWIDPYLILSVGFQLSYIAVTGILFFYPLIEKWFAPRNRIILFFWQITALSLAAQMVTAPLAAFYFHQFPTYFILTNLIVIPAATIIVWSGLALLLIGSISTSLGAIIGSLLGFIIEQMSLSLNKITQLPWASITNLAPDFPELLIVYLLLGLIAFYNQTKNKLAYRISFFVLTLLIAKVIYSQYSHRTMNQIVFYSVPKGWAIDFIKEGHYLPLADSSLSPESISYRIEPYRVENQLIHESRDVPLTVYDDLGSIAVWQGYKILIANDCLEEQAIPEVFDFVLIQSDGRNRECYFDQILFRKLVDKDGIHFERYALNKKGAFVLNI